jgi:DNA-binding CsgD family transcriptional regulator
MARTAPATIDHSLDLVGAVGSDRYPSALLALASHLVPGENAQVMAYPAAGRPIYLATQDTDSASQRLYLDHYYRFDPHYRLLRGTADFGVRRDSEIRPAGYDEGGYYSHFFAAIGVADYLSLILPVTDAASHAGIFIGRRLDFSARDRRFFETLLPALLRLGLAHRHARRGRAVPMALIAGDAPLFANAAWAAGDVPDLDWLWCVRPAERPRQLQYPQGRLYLDPLLPETTAPCLALFLPAGIDDLAADFELTPREREIVRLILAGYDNPGIALRLGIGEGTLRNHRKRLHKKLGLHAERDLFRLHLARLAQTGH